MAMLPAAGGGTHKRQVFGSGRQIGTHKPSGLTSPPSKPCPLKNQSVGERGMRLHPAGSQVRIRERRHLTYLRPKDAMAQN
jgi:hypothetical protein